MTLLELKMVSYVEPEEHRGREGSKPSASGMQIIVLQINISLHLQLRLCRLATADWRLGITHPGGEE